MGAFLHKVNLKIFIYSKYFKNMIHLLKAGDIMAYVLIEKEVNDLEIVAYNLSNLAIKEGYYTNVVGDSNEATTFIYKERFFKGVIGTPTAIKVTYKKRSKGVSIDIDIAKLEVNGENIIKETLLVLTVLPMISKLSQFIKIKNRAKILAIKALNISEV